MASKKELKELNSKKVIPGVILLFLARAKAWAPFKGRTFQEIMEGIYPGYTQDERVDRVDDVVRALRDLRMKGHVIGSYRAGTNRLTRTGRKVCARMRRAFDAKWAEPTPTSA